MAATLTITDDDVAKAEAGGYAHTQGYVWTRFVADNRALLSRATGGWQLGKQLGCGLFGCVYASRKPWVVKVTADPSEGEAWAAMRSLRQLHGRAIPELYAIPRVDDIVRVRPDLHLVNESGDERIQWQETDLPLHVVRREAALPVFDMGLVLTPETTRRVEDIAGAPLDEGLSINDLREIARQDPQMLVAAVSLVSLVRIMNDYRQLSRTFGEALLQIAEFEETRASWAAAARAEARGTALAVHSALVAVSASLRTVPGEPDLPNVLAAPLGETLGFLAASDVVFPDLHALNVGWREYPDALGFELPRTIVVLDVGQAIVPGDTDVTAIRPNARRTVPELNVDDDLDRLGVDMNAHYRAVAAEAGLDPSALPRA